MTPYADPESQRLYFSKYNARRRSADKVYRAARKAHSNALRRRRNLDRKHNPGVTLSKPVLSWEKRNPKAVAEIHRRWKRKNPEKSKLHNRKSWQARRARKLNASVNPRSIETFVNGVRSKKLVSCYYCQNPTPGATAHIDHVLALAKGGSHSVDNLCAACPKCNLSKQATLIEDWMKLGQQILAL